jgi:hypothetical protein
MIAKERIEYLALRAEIVAALGVVISVAYLAVQIGGSTTELRSQTHFNPLELAQRSIETLVADPEFADLVSTGVIDAGRIGSCTMGAIDGLLFHDVQRLEIFVFSEQFWVGVARIVAGA